MEINIWKFIHGKSVYLTQYNSNNKFKKYRVLIYRFQLHMEVFVCWNIKNLDCRSVYISHNLLFNWYAYGVFISKLIRYDRACSSYECFILRAMQLSNKLLWQGYVKERLKSSLRKFYGRYGDLTKQYEVPLSQMLHEILDDDQSLLNLSCLRTFFFFASNWRQIQSSKYHLYIGVLN